MGEQSSKSINMVSYALKIGVTRVFVSCIKPCTYHLPITWIMSFMNTVFNDYIAYRAYRLCHFYCIIFLLIMCIPDLRISGGKAKLA